MSGYVRVKSAFQSIQSCQRHRKTIKVTNETVFKHPFKTNLDLSFVLPWVWRAFQSPGLLMLAHNWSGVTATSRVSSSSGFWSTTIPNETTCVLIGLLKPLAIAQSSTGWVHSWACRKVLAGASISFINLIFSSVCCDSVCWWLDCLITSHTSGMTWTGVWTIVK